jgi:hypothetical protein
VSRPSTLEDALARLGWVERELEGFMRCGAACECCSQDAALVEVCLDVIREGSGEDDLVH